MNFLPLACRKDFQSGAGSKRVELEKLKRFWKGKRMEIRKKKSKLYPCEVDLYELIDNNMENNM